MIRGHILEYARNFYNEFDYLSVRDLLLLYALTFFDE